MEVSLLGSQLRLPAPPYIEAISSDSINASVCSEVIRSLSAFVCSDSCSAEQRHMAFNHMRMTSLVAS